MPSVQRSELIRYGVLLLVVALLALALIVFLSPIISGIYANVSYPKPEDCQNLPANVGCL